MFNGYWKRRAEQLAIDLAARDEQLESLKQALDGMELRFKERAALMSIVREGRMIRFMFARDDKLHFIQMLGTWDDDLDQWKRDLLEPINKGNNNGIEGD